jgi:hypothetical protein
MIEDGKKEKSAWLQVKWGRIYDSHRKVFLFQELSLWCEPGEGTQQTEGQRMSTVWSLSYHSRCLLNLCEKWPVSDPKPGGHKEGATCPATWEWGFWKWGVWTQFLGCLCVVFCFHILSYVKKDLKQFWVGMFQVGKCYAGREDGGNWWIG